MESKLENAVQLLQSEGFAGAYSFVFLIRWASLAGDKALLQRIGKSLEEMDSFRESAALAYVYAEYYEASRAPFCEPYVYAEYYEASRAPFCEPAAAFLIGRCSEEDPLYLAALAKCARVFRREEFFALARPLADECPPADPFAALGLLELYRATFHGEYLNRAVAVAEEIRLRFKELFSPDEAYDGEEPSFNSAVALLYDELARLTQEEQWVKAREVQNRFISLLADRYPTRVSFGLCALLSDAFEAKTIVCAVPEGKEPPELDALLSFYAPLTERIVIPTKIDTVKYFLMQNGKLEEIKGI